MNSFVLSNAFFLHSDMHTKKYCVSSATVCMDAIMRPWSRKIKQNITPKLQYQKSHYFTNLYVVVLSSHFLKEVVSKFE